MRFLYKIKRIHRKIKWKIQRANRGFSDYDTWDIDMWFIKTMKAMLEYFVENTIGAPVRYGWTEENCHEEWRKYIKRMIFLLDEMDEDKCSYKNPYEEEYENHCIERWGHEKTSKEEKLINMYLGEEQNKRIYIENCKKEFFDMFSKVFYDLWD